MHCDPRPLMMRSVGFVAEPNVSKKSSTSPWYAVGISVRSVTDDRHPFHHPTMRQKVVAHAVLRGSVVPEGHASRTPTEAALHIRDRGSALEHVQQRE